MLRITLVALALVCAVSAAKTDSGWSDVAYTDIYDSLVSCAQDCVLYVNQATSCNTYGCVCSENSGGSNFNAGAKSIADCAKQSCPNKQDVDDAATAFRDLCNPINAVNAPSASRPSTRATSSTTPTRSSSHSSSSAAASSTSTGPLLLIKPPKYDRLNPCSKFCLNSCRDANGTANEPNCHTNNKPKGWGGYKGIADQLGCTTASCLCEYEAFNTTFGKLYQSGLKFCNLLPSTADLPVPEYNRLQGVLADWCTDMNSKPTSWSHEVEGEAPGTKKGLSQESKIALGVGLSVGFFTLALQAVSAFFSWKTYITDKEFWEQLLPP
ncbi:MAG: hypothetical protein M1840_006463 [Geoglossum simile]|nr:MAG: hypothetical protein M1840_006463 [Geoglossum simile]